MQQNVPPIPENIPMQHNAQPTADIEVQPIQNVGGIDNAQPVGTAATRPRRTRKRPGYLQEYEVEYQ